MKIELIYEATCPNARGAREMIMRFLAENDLDIDFLEINKEDQGAPGYARNLASPTILVDGEDIVPGYREGHACRIYKDENGELSGLPPESALRSAVLRRIAKD